MKFPYMLNEAETDYNVNAQAAKAGPELFRRFGRGGAGVSTPAFKDKNFPQWGLKQLVAILENAYRKPRRSVCVYGSAGIGKSSIIKQFAKAAAEQSGRQFVEFNRVQEKPINSAKRAENWSGVTPSGTKNLSEEEYVSERDKLIRDPSKYFVFLDIRAGELNPEQAQGIPDVEYGKKQGYLRFLPPDWVHMISNPEFKGIVLLDEMNRADKSILAAMMQLTGERVISGRYISPGCMIVAAANMGDEFAGQVAELDPAQLRRFRNGVLVLKPEEWAAYARKVGINNYLIDYAMAVPSKNLFGQGYAVNQDIPINPATLEFASDAMNRVIADYQNLVEKNTPLPDTYTGNIYEDIRTQIEGDFGSIYTNNFMEWFEMTHQFMWDELVTKAKAGDLKSRNALNYLKNKQEQEKGKKGKEDGPSYSDEELNASKRFALTRYVTDEAITRYEEAKKEQNVAKAKQVTTKFYHDLYNIVKGVDDDQVALILKSIKSHIHAKFSVTGTEGLQKANDAWTEMIGPMTKMAAEDDPKFLAHLKKLTDEMAKHNPKGLLNKGGPKDAKFVSPFQFNEKKASFKGFYKA